MHDYLASRPCSINCYKAIIITVIMASKLYTLLHPVGSPQLSKVAIQVLTAFGVITFVLSALLTLVYFILLRFRLHKEIESGESVLLM